MLPVEGEAFRLRKLLPASGDYDFNIHVMDFHPGERGWLGGAGGWDLGAGTWVYFWKGEVSLCTPRARRGTGHTRPSHSSAARPRQAST